MFLDIFNELLAENRLNRKQFAEQCEIPYTTVIGWTNLNRLPDYTALIKIADFFHCSIDLLAGRQEPFGKQSPSVYSSMEVSQSERALIKNFRKLEQPNQELVSALTKSFAELSDNR